MINWKEIEGYNGLYEVSDVGDIRSLDRIIIRENHLLTLKGVNKSAKVNNRGYLSTTLCKNSKYQHFAIHCLVARAFIPNPENKGYVNHKDGNKLNNSVSNLEWVTMSENNKHAYKIGLKVGSAKGLFGKDNKTSKPVYMMNKQGEILKEFPAIHDASRITGLSASGICAVINGRVSTCGGYKWIHKIQKIAV